MGPRGCQRAATARAGREVNEVALKQRADVEKLNGELQAQLSKNLEFIEVNPELFRRKLVWGILVSSPERQGRILPNLSSLFTAAWLWFSAQRPKGNSPQGADHRATYLYSADPEDPDHDAVIRIGGEAPKRRVHSPLRPESHASARRAATSDRHRALLPRVNAA